MRSTNHPHVALVIRALDRAAEFEREHPDDGAVRTTAAIIFETGDNCERFARYREGKWEPEAARAITIAYARFCPDFELEWMAEWAENEIGKFDEGFYDDEEALSAPAATIG